MSPSADSSLPNDLQVLAPPKPDTVEVPIKIMMRDSTNSETPNIIEQYDTKHVEEASKLDLGNIDSIDPTDHIAMRQWLKDVYMPLPKAPLIKRTRAPIHIQIKNVPISYGQNDHFSIRIYDPIDKEASLGRQRPAVIMVHGGGWIHGYPEVDEDLSMFFASELRAVVIGVDYRLAPEYQFPLPSNDCYEVVNWVSSNAKQYMIDTTRVALWGCSAGGNLAASVALRDSAENEISRIRHVSLLAPVTCHPSLHPPILQSSNASMKAFRCDSTPEQAMAVIVKLWEKYAGSKFSDPYASVLLAQPRSNHPSTHITVAGCDRLRDEGIAYALRLRDAGVDTQLEIIPGVPHSVTMPPTTPMAAQLFRNQVRVLNCALHTDF